MTDRAPRLPFELPPPPGSAAAPRWTGNGFEVGPATVAVLNYSENQRGWTDDLTDLHEETAGAGHPIDIASRQDAIGQLRSRLDVRSPVILEIGCSSGHMLRDLARAFPGGTIVGADVVQAPLERLARAWPTVPLLRFDLLACPLPAAAFDAVVMLNVLEHIEDDRAALRQVHRVLKPGGLAVLEVPAGPHLFDDYDRALKHYRRYRGRDLHSVLDQAGFRVVRRSHLGFLLYPAFSWSKRRQQRRSDDGGLRDHVKHEIERTMASRALRFALSAEVNLGRWVSYPFGIRCLAVAVRP